MSIRAISRFALAVVLALSTLRPVLAEPIVHLPSERDWKLSTEASTQSLPLTLTSLAVTLSIILLKEEVPVVQVEAARFIVARGQAAPGLTLRKCLVEGRRLIAERAEPESHAVLSDLQLAALLLASTVGAEQP